MMDWLLLAVLLVVTLWLIATGLTRPGRVYEFPFLAGTTFLGFILPQLPAYAANPFLPQGAFAKTVLMTILCAAACGAGWIAGKRPMRAFAWHYDERRLIWVAALLSLAGGFFYYKLSRLPEAVLMVTSWTGIATIYFFFSRLVEFGLVTALLCFVNRPRPTSLLAVLCGATLLVDRIVAGGRRTEFTEFLLMIAISAWFRRGVAVPRVIALAGALAGGLALISVGDYRNVSMGKDSKWSDISKINLIQNFDELLRNGGLEMHNAIVLINFTDHTQGFDFGAFNWNMLVFNFVPAQIVGTGFKDSLMLPLPAADRAYDPVEGTTETGITDCFVSFWYFGAFKFFLIAYILGRIYRAAMAGSTTAQIIYILSIPMAMLTITHHTQEIVSGWVQMGIFLLPALALARVKSSAPAWRPPAAKAPHLASPAYGSTTGE
jgi:hypothetical protein